MLSAAISRKQYLGRGPQQQHERALYDAGELAPATCTTVSCECCATQRHVRACVCLACVRVLSLVHCLMCSFVAGAAERTVAALAAATGTYACDAHRWTQTQIHDMFTDTQQSSFSPIPWRIVLTKKTKSISFAPPRSPRGQGLGTRQYLHAYMCVCLCVCIAVSLRGQAWAQTNETQDRPPIKHRTGRTEYHVVGMVPFPVHICIYYMNTYNDTNMHTSHITCTYIYTYIY